MAKSKSLDVYSNGLLVGELVKEGTGAMTFEYSENWFESNEAIPVSLSLGFDKKKYKGPEVYNFFDNLLPDNKDIRLRVAKNVGAASDEPFDLLSAIGEDCAGALSFFPSGENPSVKKNISARAVDEEQISKIILGLKAYPLGIGDENLDFRISMAGAQEKTAFLYHDNQWKVPLGATPTTHIFKPPMGLLHNGIDLRTSVENEWLCLQLCKLYGLPVCDAEIGEFIGKKCLIVKRFDRSWKNKKELIRIPQEDFCQALGIPSHLKYESDHRKNKGLRPGLRDILSLLNESDERAKDRYDFFKAVIIFWLLGATDGHGKNFSLFITQTGFKMTPLYDVLSVYPALNKKQIQKKQAKMAMAIGDNRKYKLADITSRHFYQSGKKYGISNKKVSQIFSEIMEVSENLKDKIKLPEGFDKQIFDSITDGLLKKVNSLKE